MQVQSPGLEDPLEKGTAAHSSTLAWRIPWTEEPGGLQSIELQRVGHDLCNLAGRQAGRHLICGQYLLRLERMRSSNLVNQDFFSNYYLFFSKVSFTKP